MPLYLLDALEAIRNFFNSGGPVLYLIAVLAFVMWVLLLERAWYYLIGYRRDAKAVLEKWQARNERKSWYAHAIRRKLISETHLKIDQNLGLIKTLIALCPLFGLLGTVTGMIEVFTVLSITGGGDAKSMAGGVSRGNSADNGRHGCGTIWCICQYLYRPKGNTRARTDRRKTCV